MRAFGSGRVACQPSVSLNVVIAIRPKNGPNLGSTRSESAQRREARSQRPLLARRRSIEVSSFTLGLEVIGVRCF